MPMSFDAMTTSPVESVNKFPNLEYSYDDNKFPQLFGQTTINEYNLAIHVLENNNMFTVREVDAMITKPNEEYFE